MISIDDCTYLVVKAKTKPDGVYSARGYYYAVKNNCLKGWGEKRGDLCLFVGFGGVFAGKVKNRNQSIEGYGFVHPDDIKKALQAMI